MKRILVLGSGGAGKSTLARLLGRRLGLPVLHLDVHYWRPGWVEPAEGEWKAQVEGLVRGDAWIIDGNYRGTLAMRLARADTAVFLDLPRLACSIAVVQRYLAMRGRTRPDMQPGCPEAISWEFLRWIWDYPNRSRPRVMELLAQHRDTVTTYRFTSRRPAMQWAEGAGAVEMGQNIRGLDGH